MTRLDRAGHAMKGGVLRLLAALAFVGFAVATWIVGPMIGYGGLRPLASPGLRGGLVAAVLILLALSYAWRFLRRRQAEKRLQAVLSGPLSERDPENLDGRMAEAVKAFRARSRRRNPLRTLPWYVLLGPKGAGKTTALHGCGLSLPAGDAGPVQGVRPTEFCDWWFTDEAVLVDTAGRYTVHRPDMAADRANWLAFLALLLRNRPRQPINGVILAFSLEDLMLLSDADLDAHLATIQTRLSEITTALHVRFPVYVLFTKADLIAGFSEYFGSLDPQEEGEAWGAALRGGAPNLLTETASALNTLALRLTAALPERMGAEPDGAARRTIFAFPQQFERLEARIGRFLGAIAEQPAGPKPALHSLHGFWFSSGTREGRPVDLLGRSPVRTAAPRREGERTRTFFLRDLLPKVVLAEASWVRQRSAPARRIAVVRRAALGLIGFVALAGLSALGVSFVANHRLVRAAASAVAEIQPNKRKVLASDAVRDTDLDAVVDTLDSLRDLPGGYAGEDRPAPVWETFGLSERPRLRSAAEAAYRRGLDRVFRTRLLLQLEERIGTSLRDPAAIYEPLKIYLMLGGKAPRTDDPLVTAWFRRDWERNRYPGAMNREGRARLSEHLAAMLTLDDGQPPSVALDDKLVEAAQRSLSRLELADLASALVAAELPGADLQDITLETLAGPQAAAVFDTADGSDVRRLGIPGLYSRNGFNAFFLPQLAALGQELEAERWVLGAGGEQVALQARLSELGPRLLDGYSQDFLAAWNRMLAQIRIRPMAGEAPAYPTLAAVASASSPLRLLSEGIARETSLSEGAEAGANNSDAERMEEGLRRIGLGQFQSKGQNRVGEAPTAPVGLPGAAVEAQFRPYQLVVDGEAGQRPVDLLVRNFSDILGSLVLAANSPGQTERAGANLQLQIANLRANASRFPRPIYRMIQTAVGDFEGNAASASVTQLRQKLEKEVTGPCRAVLAGAYPFERGSERDLSVADFASLFAPKGPIDQFFAQNLSQYADTSGSEWQWRQDTALGRTLSADALKSFQQAARIRDGFFARNGSQPSLNLTITPQSLHGDIDMALMEIGGQIVQSYQAGSVPATVSWPAATAGVTVSLTPEIPGRPSSIQFSGPWALMRLLDTGSVAAAGDEAQARVVIGGRDVTYAIKTGSTANPFLPPALAEFTCPAGL